jgi:hypothetical protein
MLLLFYQTILCILPVVVRVALRGYWLKWTPNFGTNRAAFGNNFFWSSAKRDCVSSFFSSLWMSEVSFKCHQDVIGQTALSRT